MGILHITTTTTGQIGAIPRRVKIVTTDSLATFTTAGYLNPAVLEGYTIIPTDVLDVWYGATSLAVPGTYEVFTVSISNGVITAVQWANPGDVLLPVVSGDFAVFNGTTGQIKDAGYLPSNAAKTTVVMATAATVANHIMVSTDTAGTVGNRTGTALNDGSLQAGRSTVAGSLISYPSTATSGSLAVTAVASSGDYALVLSNASHGQASTYSIPDGGQATSNIIISNSAGTQTIATGSLALTSGNVTCTAGNLQAGSSGHAGTVKSYPGTAASGSFGITAVNSSGDFAGVLSNASLGQATTWTMSDPGRATSFVGQGMSGAVSILEKVFVKTINATFTALATSGHVAVMAAPSGTSQFAILDIKVLYSASGLSGGGGNRLLTLSDGTIVFNNAGITAALLGTPIYTVWGGTGNPLPSAVSVTSTAGAAIYLVYSGGATDYTAGSVNIQVTLQQVTA